MSEGIHHTNMNSPPSEPEKVYKDRSYLLEVLIGIMTLMVLIIFFWDFIVINIPAGHKGVKFKPLEGGTVVDRYWDEGITLIFPWNEMYIYDTRVISRQDTIIALTEDGIEVEAEISFRYRPEIDSLGLMHKNLGLNYAKNIIIPHVTAATRDVVSRYEIEALYTTSRSNIQSEMLLQVHKQVDARYPVTTLDLILRNISLDSIVSRSIANKLVKEQEMEAYDYVLEMELKEEERKLIEARGIKLFQDTSRINILQWAGIEATKELANSPNAKVVIIGTESGDLPVILGGN